jgi:hypothetical protein
MDYSTDSLQEHKKTRLAVVFLMIAVVTPYCITRPWEPKWHTTLCIVSSISYRSY